MAVIFAEWQVTASSAYRYAPDRRDFVMASSRDSVNATDIDAFRSEFNFGATNDQQDVELRNFFIEPGSIVRRYDDLLDTNVDVSFDITIDAMGRRLSFFKRPLRRLGNRSRQGTLTAKVTGSISIKPDLSCFSLTICSYRK